MKGMSDLAAAKLLADVERSTWQYRAIAATKGNQTFLGCALLAVLGIAPDNPPRFVYPAIYIDADGQVRSFIQRQDGTVEGLAAYHAAGAKDSHKERLKYMPKLCSIEDLRDNFRRLADHCKMTDAERVQFFDLIRKWVELDVRAIKTDVIGPTLITKASA